MVLYCTKENDKEKKCIHESHSLGFNKQLNIIACKVEEQRNKNNLKIEINDNEYITIDTTNDKRKSADIKADIRMKEKQSLPEKSALIFNKGFYYITNKSIVIRRMEI
ncbi:TPA: hypothetical protein SAO79_001002 [Campylobacter jejuni]|uniref:hypothetical protein n=1 Tax=Campylobacter TaxID=194 RepID=UPI00126B2E93|nr:hypothetical protein [Campylobacter jejuni]HEB7622624.1 hypothetical protein [Campylobacter coli]EAJ5474069.1 hypothetical protein [Campylobacter jejuni]EAK3632942.1 hypothetical protein [Campylobacter jejuni]EAK4034133.1 hypothetical protein [Campylobacter jejuni]EAK6880209.1 hypothetical protein [Campylobacter jejuni]